jgi:adenylylsulfate kinase
MNHIVRHNGYVSKEDRNRLNRHNSGIVWFTGLSASGKSTIAHHIEKRLFQQGIRTYVFDGDNIRHGLNSNLGFSPEDRTENLRRIVEVSKLFVDAGVVVLASFITPLNKQRIFIRSLLEGYKFIEVYVKCDIEECIRRDPKGLYKKAQAGLISNYTGISSPFEEPDSPDFTVDTQKHSIQESVDIIYEYLEKAFLLNMDDHASGTAPQDKIRANDG